MLFILGADKGKEIETDIIIIAFRKKGKPKESYKELISLFSSFKKKVWN